MNNNKHNQNNDLEGGFTMTNSHTWGRWAVLVGYLSTIPAANWLINNFGTQQFAGGPHTIPVGFGFDAPSGVLLIGVALVCRDVVQETFGKATTLGAICVGVAASYFVNPAVATASAVAFAVGELCDFAIYTNIRKHHKALAVATSGVVGGAIDSFVFLQIAFGSTQFWEGQIIGKALVACCAAVLLHTANVVSQRLPARQS